MRGRSLSAEAKARGEMGREEAEVVVDILCDGGECVLRSVGLELYFDESEAGSIY